MKRGESPTDDEKADGQREEALGAQPLKKRLKTSKDDDEESEDDAAEVAADSKAKQGVARLKSVPEDKEEEEEEEDTTKMAAASPTGATQAAAGATPVASTPLELMTQSFPQRLMEMLDSNKVPDAMWWAEEGKAFAMDLSKFEDVLHRHFQATKYASFTRKLNKWGFRKINNIDPETPESVVLYRHDLFQQNRPDLLASMSTKRKPKKKDKKDKESSSKKQKDDSNRSGDEDVAETNTKTDAKKEEEKRDASRQEEEKAYSDESEQRHLRQILRPFQESETKSDGASAGESTTNVRRQRVQQDLSLASSLATHRMTGQQPGAMGVQDLPPSLAVASLQQEQRDRLFLQSLLAQESEQQQLQSLMAQESGQQQQQQRMLENLLFRQQQQGSLASEMVAQRHLAATSSSVTNRIPHALASSMTLEDRLSALQNPALQGIHQLTGDAASRTIPPARSHSMTDLQNTHLSDLAARLLGLQQQAQGQGNPPLHLQGQNYSDQLRAAMDARSSLDITSALQLMPSSPAQHHLAMPNNRLASLDLLSSPNLSAAVHPSMHHSRSFPGASSLLQLQLERQVELSRRSSSMSATAAAAGGAASFPTAGGALLPASNPNDQQLLEILLERQRLEQQLQEEHRRRQQGR